MSHPKAHSMRVTQNVAIWFIATALVGCFREDRPQVQTPPPPPAQIPVALKLEESQIDDSTKVFLRENWPRALKTCPGLALYGYDVTFRDAHEVPALFPGDRAVVEVSVQIAEIPRQIPDRFGAGGHTCSFKIAASSSSLSTSKTACANTCLNRDAGDTHGRDLTLKLVPL